MRVFKVGKSANIQTHNPLLLETNQKINKFADF